MILFILRTILGQCFHAFHFPAFQPFSFISILTFEQTNQLYNTIHIKDHFRAVLSCFPLSSFPKAGKHCPKMVLNITVYIKHHFRAVLSCFPLSSFLKAGEHCPKMVVNIYSITVVYIYLYIVYIIKFYIRTNTITGAILPGQPQLM